VCRIWQRQILADFRRRRAKPDQLSGDGVRHHRFVRSAKYSASSRTSVTQFRKAASILSFEPGPARVLLRSLRGNFSVGFVISVMQGAVPPAQAVVKKARGMTWQGGSEGDVESVG